MQKRFIILTACVGLLGGCVTPQSIENTSSPVVEKVVRNEAGALSSWWSFFNDPVLDRLVSSALALNASQNTQFKTGEDAPDPQDPLRLIYNDPQADLVSDVVQNYILYRYIQGQKSLLTSYIQDDRSLLSGLAEEWNDDANKPSDPRLAKIKADIEVLSRQNVGLTAEEQKAIEKITRATTLLPEFIVQVLKKETPLPTADILPLFASPSTVMAGASAVVIARETFARDGGEDADTSKLFPDIAMNRFFGVSDEVYSNSDSLWSVSVGRSVEQIDLSGVQAQYEGKPAYNTFKNTLFSYVMDIERSFVFYAHIQQQYLVLKAAAMEEQLKYDVTKEDSEGQAVSYEAYAAARASLYTAQHAELRARYEQIKTLLDIYKRLEVY